MDIVTAGSAVLLILIGILFASAPRRLRFAFFGGAILITFGSYVDEPFIRAAEQSKRAAAIANAEAAAREKQEREAQRRQQERKRQQADAARKAREFERERQRQAEIVRRAPNAFKIFSLSLRGGTNNYLPATRECVVDDLDKWRMGNVTRRIDINQKRVYYHVENRYARPVFRVMFFDNIDRTCEQSFQWLVSQGHLNGTRFTRQQTWQNVSRALASNASPSTESGGENTNQQARNSQGQTAPQPQGSSSRYVGTYEFQRVQLPSGNQGGRLRLAAKRKCFAFLPNGEDGSAGAVEMATNGNIVVATNKVRWTPKRARVFWYDDYGKGCQDSYRQLLVSREVGFLNVYQRDVGQGRAEPAQIATMGQGNNPAGNLEEGVEQLGREFEKGVENVKREVEKAIENIFKR